MKRYADTRHLIALGELVQRSGLTDLTGGDHATLYGALLNLVTQARSDDARDLLPIWRQCGEEAI